MMLQFLENKRVQYVLIAMMILGVIICIVTPHMRYLRVFTRYTVLLLLIYFVVAMAFLMLRQQRLMFTALGCCAALCIFLKSSGGPGLKRPKLTKDPMVTIAHFNMSSGQEDYKSAIATILSTNADVISLQELTPDWYAIIRDSITAIYPYSRVSIGSDMYGLGLFSRKQILACDTFYCDEIPNLDIALELKQDKKIHVISSYISPPLWSGAYAQVNKQLQTIAQHTEKIKTPVITLGDYNIEPWSREIREFKSAVGMSDSRLWYTADTPLNHIYYSKQFDCVGFENVASSASQELGIIGTYQLQQAKSKN